MKTSPHSELRLLAKSKASIIKSSDKFRQISKERSCLPAKLYDSLNEWIHASAFLEKSIYNAKFPSAYSGLRKGPYLEEISLEKEFRWGWSFLSSYKKEMAYFVTKAIEFETCFLGGDLAGCTETLNDIEHKLGLSLWLVKNRLALLQHTGGLEAQKKMAIEIQEKTEAIASFLTFYLSYRTEPAVTPVRYIQSTTKVIDNFRIPDSLKVYLKYHLIPGFLPHLSEIPAVLSWEGGGTIVDYYVSIVTQTANLVSQNLEFEKIDRCLSNSKLKTFIDDPAIDLVCSLKRQSPLTNRYAEDSIALFDLFLSGRLKDAVDFALKVIDKYPNDYSAIEILARCLAVTGVDIEISSSFSLRIANLLKSIYLRESNFHTDLFASIKLSWDFLGMRWAVSLLSSCIREAPEMKLHCPPNFNAFAVVYSYSVNPYRLTCFPLGQLRQAYAKIAGNQQTHHRVAAFADACSVRDEACNLTGISLEEGLLLKAENLLSENKYSECYATAIELATSSQDYYRNRSIRMVANCLLGMGKIKECMGHIIDCHLLGRNLEDLLPISKILSAIDINFLKKEAALIDIPIFYDIAHKNDGQIDDSLRSFSYEDFLMANQITRPSQMKSIYQRFGHDRIIYFLREVCIESVMDSSVFFESSEDISNERIAVLELLTELDKGNAATYMTEIRALIKKQALKTHFKEIERSKIYVDIDGVKKSAEKEIKESYLRYQSFLKGGLDDTNMTLREDARRHLKEGEIAKLLSLALPINEMNSLIEHMIVELRDTFVSSPEHGLDKYLSVRIRHGTLTSHLRSPLETENIITQKDTQSGKHRDPIYWINKLSSQTRPYKKDRLIECIVSFSEQFDKLIESILKEWIQIKVNPEQSGLFDFTLIKSHIVYMASLVNRDTSFESFLDIVFEHLYVSLDQSLHNIREQFDKFAKQQANTLISELQDRIARLNLDADDISGSIYRARTNMMFAFDRVIEWFRYSPPSESAPFFIEDVISVSEASVRVSCRDFRVVTDISDTMKKTMVQGKFASFVDIFFIVFENIVRHSNTSEKFGATIKCELKESKIEMITINKIGKDVRSANLEKVNGLKVSVGKRQYGDAISREGGTGLHKIRQILSHDFNLIGGDIDPDLDFGFCDPDEFYVAISIPVKSIIYER